MSSSTVVVDVENGSGAQDVPISETLSKDTAVIVAIQSARCFAIPAGDVTNVRWQSRKTLAIDLEPYLPTDAEEIAVDVIRSRVGPTLAVACNRTGLESVIREIETAGGWIAAISPHALLIAQSLIAHRVVPQDCDLAISNGETAWDYVELREGLPVAWQWTSEDTVRSRAESNRITSSRSPLYIVGASDTAFASRIEENSAEHQANFVLLDASTQSTVEELAAKIVSGKLSPWVDFRRGGITCSDPLRPIRSALTALSLSLVVSLGVLFGFLWWRTSDLAGRVLSEQERQVQLFKKLYPNQVPPVDIPGRLRSEEKRLQLAAADLRQELPIESSFPILVHWLNHLPEDAKFKIDRIQVQSAQIQVVDGAVESLAEFEKFTSSLRRDGYEFATPSFSQTDKGGPLKLERVRRKVPAKKEGKK